jgi:hypothetical protein
MSALAAYIAAVYPAGPDPMIKHFILSICSDIDKNFWNTKIRFKSGYRIRKQLVFIIRLSNKWML